eukprot:SAG31_NODE_1045_length_10180_cov_5.454221_16_plen_40_part_00
MINPFPAPTIISIKIVQVGVVLYLNLPEFKGFLKNASWY